MKVLIKLASFASIIAFAFCNTSDPEFEKLYQVKHLKEGDGKSFPTAGTQATVH